MSDNYQQYHAETAAWADAGGNATFDWWDTDAWLEGQKAIAKAAKDTTGKTRVEMRRGLRQVEGEGLRFVVWVCLKERQADGSWHYLAGYDISFPCPPWC